MLLNENEGLRRLLPDGLTYSGAVVAGVEAGEGRAVVMILILDRCHDGDGLSAENVRCHVEIQIEGGRPRGRD